MSGRAQLTRLTLWVTLLLLCAACGGATGDPVRGEALFRAAPAEGGLPCVECHSLSPGVASPLGPSLAGIGVRAGEVVPGQPAVVYLREAILDPDAYLAASFQEGIMPRTYRESLSDAQVADLVTYLLTLR